MSVVTRYAPSPSGALHIGGARTALFCWAYARRHGGRFVLRFEDTDKERSSEASEQAVLEALTWLGIDWDPVPGFDGIPHQSQRSERYAEIVASLLDGGHAFRCVCTPEDLEAMRSRAREEGRKRTYDRSCRDLGIAADDPRPWCVRLKVPDRDALTRWQDEIAGPSGEAPEDLDDFVIARSDGSAIYHLAVVVDDHDMGISHVLRGREHITSTPRQLLIYQALGWTPPVFAHVPLLVEPGGKKLSKRVDSVSVQAYRDRGFTPEAVLNYIARLGWGDGDLEIFSRDELAQRFSLAGVGSKPSEVHEDKLLWLGQHYLKELPRERLVAAIAPFLERVAGRPVDIDDGLATLLDLLRPRARTLLEMAEQAAFYWTDEPDYEPKAERKFLKPEAAEPLRALRDALAGLDTWTPESLEPVFEDVAARRELKLGKLAQPVRVAVTGTSASPGIYETLAALGRERTLPRLDRALARLAERA